MKAILPVILLISISFSGSAVYGQESPIEPVSAPIVGALNTFLETLAESAPNVIAATILLAIGLVAGKVVGRIVAKFAKKVLERAELIKEPTGLVQEIAGKKVDSPALIAATVRWFIYLFFIVAAVNALQFEQLSNALAALWLWVPNILAFILIVVIGFIIVGFVAKWIDQQLETKQLTAYKYISTPVKVIMYFVIFAVALTQLGIGQTIIPILVSAFSWSLAIAIAAAVAIGLGFALKDILPAVIASALTQRAILKKGQVVRIGAVTGTVSEVGLFHVMIQKTPDERVIIPTNELMYKTITIIEEKTPQQAD